MSTHFLHITGTDPLPPALRGGAVAIGNVDGVHLGHQALLAAARNWARAHGRPALLLTFEPHPKVYFRPSEPLFRLTPPDLKAERVAAAGLEAMVSWPFDAALAGMTADSFCRHVLADALGAAHVVTGADFAFGKGRSGDTAALARLGSGMGFTAEALPVVAEGDLPVSSTRIREALAAGDIATANRLLGWEWCVSADVLHGDKRGRELGYPTANLHLDPSVALAHGIYAVRATVAGVAHAAVASFGRRPTFDGGQPKLEVHVFDFAGDLYGQRMTVTFVGFIRPELKFDSIEVLVKRMDEDSGIARALLAGA